jgi:Domain of unknown function (DUF4351)
MHKPSEQSYKQFVRDLVGTVLTGAGVDVEMDVEVPHPTEVVTHVFGPRRRLPRLPPDDCMERIATMVPGMMECHGDVVRVDDIEASIDKRDRLYQQRLRRARGQNRPELPHLWIMTLCRPRKVMREYEAEPMAGWPPGFWTLRREQRLYLVALPALPRTPETLTLRLIPSGATREQALREYAVLPPDSPRARALGPLIEAADRAAEPQKPAKGSALEQVHAMYERLERKVIDRGRQEGEVELLLRLLARRFGTVPEAVTARVTRARIEDIQRWFDRAVDAATLDDVFAR